MEPTAIKMRNRNGKLSNLMFSDNNKVMFIHVQSGDVWLENITFNGNEIEKMDEH